MTAVIAIRDRIAGIRPGYRRGLKTAGVISIYLVVAIALYWDVWSTSPTSVTQLGGDQYGTVWFFSGSRLPWPTATTRSSPITPTIRTE